MNSITEPSDRFSLFLGAMERVHSLFCLYDKDYKLIFANNAACQAMPEFCNALLQGKTLEEATRLEIKRSAPDHSAEEQEQLTRIFLEKQLSGETYEVSGTQDRLFAVSHGEIDENYILGLGMDVTESKKQRKKLEALATQNSILANTDQLTGLSNRRRFVEVLESNIKRASEKNTTFHLGLIDLNGFKRINDVYGHGIGDMLLTQVANRLGTLVEKNDFVSRLGGDEFAIIYPKDANVEHLVSYSEALCHAIELPYHLAGNPIEISSSLGWSSYPKDGETSSDLLRKSDYALYQSKRAGNKKAVIFSLEHEEKIHRQSRICFQLEHANLEEELYLEFQPIHNTSDNSIIAFEALARWKNAELGAITPTEFIPLAERVGRISQLSTILLKKALHIAKDWPAGIDLHFNLSGIDLGKTPLIEEFVRLVQASKFSTHSVVFEITETAIINNLNEMSPVFDILKEAGIKLALDDFGIGYSSLSYLRKIPVTSLKIDKSFTDSLRLDVDEDAILQTIIYLCEKLQIDCIIEGVEYSSQYNHLKSIGLENMQGFYFSRAMPADELASYMLIESGLIDTAAAQNGAPNDLAKQG